MRDLQMTKWAVGPTNIRRAATSLLIAIAWAGAAHGQPESQNFAVREKPMNDRGKVSVTVLDSGHKVLFSRTAWRPLCARGDRDCNLLNCRKVALTALNLGPNKLIAAGHFTVVIDDFIQGYYVAHLHRD